MRLTGVNISLPPRERTSQSMNENQRGSGPTDLKMVLARAGSYHQLYSLLHLTRHTDDLNRITSSLDADRLSFNEISRDACQFCRMAVIDGMRGTGVKHHCQVGQHIKRGFHALF